MINKKIKKNLIAGIKVIISVFVCAAGVQFLVLAGLGMDPLTGFESALASQLNITLGQAALLFEGATFCLFMFINRKLLNFGSFAFCFGIGPCIDFWAGILAGIDQGKDIKSSFILMVIGSLLIIVGIAYYVPLNFGLQSLDMYSVSIGELLHKGYAVGLTITYFLMIVGALILGVLPGPATLIAMTVYGYLIEKVRMIFNWQVKNK